MCLIFMDEIAYILLCMSYSSLDVLHLSMFRIDEYSYLFIFHSLCAKNCIHVCVCVLISLNLFLGQFHFCFWIQEFIKYRKITEIRFWSNTAMHDQSTQYFKNMEPYLFALMISDKITKINFFISNQSAVDNVQHMYSSFGKNPFFKLFICFICHLFFRKSLSYKNRIMFIQILSYKYKIPIKSPWF